MSNYTDISGWYARIGPRQFKAVVTVQWDIGRKGSGFTYEVPPEFCFDVSIPWYLRCIFNPTRPDFLKAAALHDHMRMVEDWDRRTAGAIFHEALKADGVRLATRFAMWGAVSLYRYD